MESVIESESALANHLIDKYRDSIKLRYGYGHLSAQFILSSQLNEEVVEILRDYFLQCLYPTADERKKVDEAFDSLRSFTRHPAKTWALLGNMAAAIFKFGMQFPQAVKAGVVSLESYIDAKRFEQELLKAALRRKMSIPLSDEQFESCISDIPRKDIENFTRHIISLFKSMANTSLLKKTISIMDDVLLKIKTNKSLYSKKDAEGIELGIHILRQGYVLFKNYPESLKTEIIATIASNEKWYLDKIYGSGE